MSCSLSWRASLQRQRLMSLLGLTLLKSTLFLPKAHTTSQHKENHICEKRHLFEHD